MSSATAKISVSVPAELVEAVRERVGAGHLSSFVARAMRHELEREQLGTWLQELDAEHGPVPPELLAEARMKWPKR